MVNGKMIICFWAGIALLGMNIFNVYAGESLNQVNHNVGPTSIGIKGIVVGKNGNPADGETVYLFGVDKEGYILQEFLGGKLSNPRDTTNAKGHFFIVIDAEFASKYYGYTIGQFSFSNFKASHLLRDGIPVRLLISNTSNIGKTINIGKIKIK